MKKIFALALALMMALSMAACAKKTESSPDGTLYYGCVTFGSISEDEYSLLAQEWEKETLGSDTYADGTKIDQWKVKFFDDLQTGLLALKKGDIMEMGMPKATADYIMAQSAGKYTADGSDYKFESVLSMALKEENKALRDKINSALAALEEEGKLADLEKRYINTAEPDAMAIPTIDGAETIKVLVCGDQPPYDFVAADGTAAGYNIALLSEISQKINMNIELVCANSGARFASLGSGKVDVVFCTLGCVMADGTVDYSADLPKDCITTVAYARQSNVSLRLAK